MSVFTKRLKEARTLAGLSQERLGVMADIDEMSSSARMNQYERGKHEPDFSMVERIAKALNMPEAYFYAKDDDAAWLLVAFHRMSAPDRANLIRAAREIAPRGRGQNNVLLLQPSSVPIVTLSESFAARRLGKIGRTVQF
jgi:transcriptional regulator with XRE-family HTH domain